MSDSFYGGAPGNSFIIKEVFNSVEEMKAAFSKGANYTDVWYHEYCLIDTPNKNHRDNGKIFQRGLDYQDPETAGSIYIGQIVGPSGGTPYMQITNIETIKDIAGTPMGDYEYKRYPIMKDENGFFVTTDEGDGHDILIDSYGTENPAPSLIPGKKINDDGTIEYRDELRYTWCNIRKDNNTSDSWFYIALEIPYTVIDKSVHTSSPYYLEDGVDPDGNPYKAGDRIPTILNPDGTVKITPATIERVDDKTHPFYMHYNLGLPKGIKGDSLAAFRVIVPTADDVIYDFSAITFDENPTTNFPGERPVIIGSPGYEGQQDDIDNQREILVYDLYIYDLTRNPDPITIYVGDYNLIDDVTLDADGTLTIHYTHDDDTVFAKTIRWIDNITLTTGDGKNGGHFQIDYNNGDPSFEEDITWPKSVEVLEDGTVKHIYAGIGEPGSGIDPDTGIKLQENLIKWITNVNLTTGNGVDGGHFNIDFNNGTPSYETDLMWIKNIEIKSDGTIIYTHAGSDPDNGVNEQGIKTEPKKLQWVNGANLNVENGKLVLTYSNDAPPYETVLDWVKSIRLDADGTIHFIHTAEQPFGTSDNPAASQDEYYNNAIKWVTGVKLDPTNGKFTMNFNYGDPYVEQLNWVTGIEIDEATGNIVIKNSDPTVGDILLDAKLKLITQAQAYADGTVQFITNTNESIFVEQVEDSTKHFHIQRIDDVKIDTNIEDDKHIQVKYNTKPDYEKIGQPINFIQDVVIRKTDFHLLVLFSDPSHRITEKDLVRDDETGLLTNKDKDGNIWYNNITGSNGTIYSPTIYWRDFGPTRDESGILIGFKLTKKDLDKGNTNGPSTNPVLNYLNNRFPAGLTGAEGPEVDGWQATRGKIVTYSLGANENEKQDFYAFDYLKKTWYYLGEINDKFRLDVALAVPENADLHDFYQSILPTNGLYFMGETFETNDSPIPEFWNPRYANWNGEDPVPIPPKKYTLQFKANIEGVNDPASRVAEENTTMTDFPQLEKEGWIFNGWSTTQDGTNITTSLILTTNTILYGVWEEIPPLKYVITFDSLGGSSVDSIEAEVNAEITELPVPTKEDNLFEGWCIDNPPVTVVTSITLTENITLYAKWKQWVKHTITFRNYDDSATVKTVDFYDDEIPFTLKASDLTRPSTSTRYDWFIGWGDAAWHPTSSSVTTDTVPQKITTETEFNEDTTIYAIDGQQISCINMHEIGKEYLTGSAGLKVAVWPRTVINSQADWVSVINSFSEYNSNKKFDDNFIVPTGFEDNYYGTWSKYYSLSVSKYSPYMDGSTIQYTYPYTIGDKAIGNVGMGSIDIDLCAFWEGKIKIHFIDENADTLPEDLIVTEMEAQKTTFKSFKPIRKGYTVKSVKVKGEETNWRTVSALTDNVYKYFDLVTTLKGVLNVTFEWQKVTAATFMFSADGRNSSKIFSNPKLSIYVDPNNIEEYPLTVATSVPGETAVQRNTYKIPKATAGNALNTLMTYAADFNDVNFGIFSLTQKWKAQIQEAEGVYNNFQSRYVDLKADGNYFNTHSSDEIQFNWKKSRSDSGHDSSLIEMYFTAYEEDLDNYYIYINADSWTSLMGTAVKETVRFLKVQISGAWSFPR